MNKSKFLKKSLATILAIMMVVAMIPVGAVAAETPSISSVTINGTAATLSGTTYSADITNPIAAPTVTIMLKDGNGRVQHFNDGGANDAAEANGVWTFDMNTAEYGDKKATFRVFSNDGTQLAGTYTVAYTVKARNGDTSIKSVTMDKQYGATTVSGSDYTIIAPYGTTTNQSVTVTLNASTSQIGGQYGTATLSVPVGTKTPFTVIAENSASVNYSVTVKVADLFSSFSVPDQVKDAAIDATGETVSVFLPYGYDVNKDIIPTFTTAYASVKITSSKLTADLKSGETKYSLTKLGVSSPDSVDGVAYDKYTDTLDVTYTDGSDSWTLNVYVAQKDTVPAIKSLEVNNFVGVINGTNISLELPASVQRVATDIKMGASKDTEISVVGTAITPAVANSSDVATLSSAAGWISAGTKTLRVKSADTKTTQDYTLTITTAEAKPAQITGLVLEDAKGNQYTAEINQTTGVITFTLPYSVKDIDDVVGYKLYYTITSGATFTSGLTGFTSGSAIAKPAQTNIFPAAFGGSAADVTVETLDNSTKTYKVAVKNLAPSTASTLTGFQLAKNTVTKYSQITETNVIAPTVSGNSFTVNVDYNVYDDYKDGFVAAVLPEGAELYYVDNTNKLKTLDVLYDGNDNAASAKLPAADGSFPYDGATAGNKPLVLVVVGESIADSVADGVTFDADFAMDNIGQYSTYNLTIKKNNPRNGRTLTGLTVYDHASKKEVKASIDQTNLLVTIKLPYYFDANKAAGLANLWLDYEVTGGETVEEVSSGTVTLNDLEFDADGNPTGTPLVASADAGTLTRSPSGVFEKIMLTAEDGSGDTTYTLVVAFDEAEKGAALESVTINNITAKPDANNKVVVNLPYGTEITSLTPVFTTSKNAWVSMTSTAPYRPAYAGAALNFTTSKQFIVVSEDGASTTTYTVEVTTADQFVDVPADAWYYNAVMEAAAMGIVGGIGDGRFNPKGNVTRGQFALMIARLENFNQADYADKNTFSDVTAGTEMAAAIEYCVEKGYVGGYGDTTYKPNNNIKREEMAKIVSLAMGYTPVTNVADNDKYADDGQISNWAKGYVYACKTNGMLGGQGGNKFAPKATTTRAEAATVVVRMANAK